MALEDLDRDTAADWSRALTLAERARAARAIPATPAPDVPAAARGRIDPWKRQAPFDRGDWMARRLSLDGLDEEGLGRLLAIPPADLAVHLEALPGWMVELTSAFSEPRRDGAALEHDPSQGLLEWVRPLVSRAVPSPRSRRSPAPCRRRAM